MIYFLNTAILPNTGAYSYKEISLNEALKIWNNTDYDKRISAIGHPDTVKILKELGFDIEYNRIEVKMEQDDKAIVFKLNKRLQEGQVLTADEIKEIGFFFGLLIREL